MKMVFAPVYGTSLQPVEKSSELADSDGLFLYFATGSKASIFVRKTLLIRLRDQQCASIGKLARQDQRFSMKMMFAPVYGTSLQHVEKSPERASSCKLFSRLALCI